MRRLAPILMVSRDADNARGSAVPTTAAVAFEESVRRMNPVTAPQDQRESVAALLELLKHVATERSEPAAYKLVSPTGEVTELPESVFLGICEFFVGIWRWFVGFFQAMVACTWLPFIVASRANTREDARCAAPPGRQNPLYSTSCFAVSPTSPIPGK